MDTFEPSTATKEELDAELLTVVQEFPHQGAVLTDVLGRAQILAQYLDAVQLGVLIEGLLSIPMLQSISQSTRLTVFALLLSSLERVTEVPATSEFLNAFINAIDGERDPRCLLKTFEMHARISQILRADGIANASPQLHEDMFDVASCYFPIAYSPPKSEKNPVKKSELKEALMTTCCLDTYANFAIPFALDKLSSPIGETKHDSLAFIRKCCELYGDNAHHLVEPFFVDLWPQIRTETLQGTMRGDDMVLKQVFETVRVLSQLVARFDNDDIIHAHLKPLFDGVLNMASAREGFINKKAYSALMHFTAVSDRRILLVIVSRLIGMLHGAFLERPEDNDRRIAILSIYSAVLGAVAKSGLHRDEVFSTEAHCRSLALMREAVFAVAGDAGVDVEGLVVCAEACSSIVSFSGAEGDNEAAALLVKISLDVEDEEARKIVIRALQASTEQMRACTTQITIPHLLKPNPVDTPRALEALSAIAKDSQTFSTCLSQGIRQLSTPDVFMVDAFLALAETRWDTAPTRCEQDAITAQEFESAIGVLRALQGPAEKVLHAVLLVFNTLFTEATQVEILAKLHSIEGMSDLTCALACGMTGPTACIDTADASTMWTLLQDPSQLWYATAFASRLNKADLALPPQWETSPHWGVLARAGLMRGGVVAKECLEKVVSHAEALDEKNVRQYELLLSHKTRGLAKILGHKSAPLWKQKTYSLTLKALLKSYNTEEHPARDSVFQSVAEVVSRANPAVVAADTEQLLPVVAKGMIGSGPALGVASLAILQTLLETAPTAFAKLTLLRTLIPSVLKLTECSESKLLRKNALTFLYTISQKKETSAALMSFKDVVIAALRIPLDDPKRMVRQTAAQARASWYLLA